MTSTTIDDRMSDSASIQWFYVEAEDHIEEHREHIWSWLQPKPKLPRVYPQQLMNINPCNFNVPMRYQKMFQGHRFRLGGHKE